MVASGTATTMTDYDYYDYRLKLVALLQLAYSGEKAAAYAYAGHWRSVKSPSQREKIKKIEQEEWEHRAAVGKMLSDLGEKPKLWREIWMTIIGRCVSIGCFLSGWFIPMYLAGKLENDNVNEYDTAANFAEQLGLNELLPELRAMTMTEEEHEFFFSEMASGHPLLPFIRAIFKWDPEPVLLANRNSGSEPEST